MSIKVYRKGVDEKVSANFSSGEFDCKCDHNECFFTYIDDNLISNLQKLRESLKFSIKITSGYRCLQHQADLKASGKETSSKVSMHSSGGAIDISSKGFTGVQLEEFAVKAGFKSIGVAVNWIHIDVRADKVRRWSYNE